MLRTTDTFTFILHAPNKPDLGRHTKWEVNAFLTEFAFAPGRYTLDCTRAEYQAMTPAQREKATERVAAWSPRLYSCFSREVAALVLEGEYRGTIVELKRRSEAAGWAPGVIHATLEDRGGLVRDVRMIFPLGEAVKDDIAAAFQKAFAEHLGIALRPAPSRVNERYLFPAAFSDCQSEVVLLSGTILLRLVAEG